MQLLMLTKRYPGFTIVELLIVIVVIAILATISIVAYNGIQKRAQTAKITSDLTQLENAIYLARVNIGERPLRYVTHNVATASGCANEVDGTDLAALNKTTDTCWTTYVAALSAISNASGMNVNNLVDPWGRPYFIENEKQSNTAACDPRDQIAVYANPYVAGWSSQTNSIYVPYITPGC